MTPSASGNRPARRRSRAAVRGAAALSTAAICLSRVAGAATTVYTGAATGDAANFNNPNNWMTAAVPTSVDAAIFNDAGLTNAASGVIDTGANQSVSQLVFGGPAYQLVNPADATFSLNNNAVTLNSVASTSSAALYRSNASVGTQTINSNLVLAKTGEQFYLNGSTGSVVINGAIGQAAGVSAFLTKAGNGTVELAGANTFSGGFGLAGGTAIVDNAAALGADTADPVSVSNASSGFAASLLTNSGVTLPYNINVVASTATPGLQVTLGGAPGQTASTWAGTVTLNRNVALVGGSAGTTTFAGVIFNAVGITPVVSKLGTGTVALTAANTYAGTTNVSAGTLRVNNTTGSGTGSGTVTVLAGATLGGTGNISGGVIVSGNISAGSSATTVGTLTTGSQSWNAGGGYVANFAGTATGDRLVMSGLTISATNVPGSQFLVTPQNVALSAGTSYVIATDANTSTGTADPFKAALTIGSLTLAPGSSVSPTTGDTLTLSSVPNGVGYDLLLNDVLSTAPEPTSLLLAAAAAAPLALGRRRRRRAGI